MKMTLSRRILLGFGICTLVLIAVAIFSFRNSERFVNAGNMVTHTHEVLSELDRTLAGTLEAESATRGYIISGDSGHLLNYQNAVESAKLHLAKAGSLTADNPIQQESIEQLRTQLDLRRANLNEAIKLRSQSRDQASAFISNNQGKLIQEEIKRIVANARNVELALLEKRKMASESDAKNFSTVFISLLVIIGIVLAAVYWVIANNLRALRRAEQETAEKNWLLTGSFQLNETIRGEKETALLAQIIIEQMCSYLNAQVGAFYIQENGSFIRSGGYALPETAPESVMPGETLVGQAAAQKKTIQFTDIPPGYLPISSASGRATPKSIACLPLLMDDQIRGVIEIGAARIFSPLDIQLMERSAETIAIAVAAAQSRTRTQKLLEESQQLTEELEAQQEELKQFNEELQEKTDLLERSEGELKAQQEELQQINEELEEKANLLEEQRSQLENARAELERRAKELELTSKYKTEFLANMSHELRTPLNSILILSKILSENKENRLNAKEVEFARNIHNSGNDQLKLINEILDLSKVEAGKMDLEIQEMTLDEVISGKHAMFDEQAKSKFIEFVIDRDPGLENIFATDKQRLQQILRNLLSNAFKFTPRGGKVTLSIKRADPSQQSGNPVIAFSVTDTGIGIPKDKLHLIFEAFRQADGSTKRKFGGTGLGLSISRELAHALGGELIVTSEEGKGSTFTLLLPQRFSESLKVEGEIRFETKQHIPLPPVEEKPAERFPKKEGEPHDDRHEITEKDKVILIMEDDPAFASLLMNFVRDRKYKAVVATQGNTGLSYARYYKPDAILLDMKLPVMNGSEVLKYLKNDPSLRHIPVQIISGYDLKKESLELGAFDFLRKPVEKDSLMDAFDRIEDFSNRKMKKLLVVEDNEQQNTAIRELIGNGDVKSFPAFSGQQAYEMLSNDHFDCVIVDLGLPDMSGFDLLEKIKDTETLKRIPIIVYTGRDLSREENVQLMKYASTVVLKTANSHERLLDETMLFLHRVESKLPKEKQHIIRKLHRSDEVLVGKKVLVVDDDIRNIYSLTNVLEEEGMECVIADNGRKAVEELKAHPEIDIVLMDIMMPEMDGYEATKAIRAIPEFEKTPIIALTAKAIKGDREKCLDAGMSDYISKPLNVEQLLSLMRVWLYK